MLSRVRRPKIALFAFFVLSASVFGFLGAPAADAADPISFTFRFVNGETITGVATDKEHFIPNAGGTSVDNPTGMTVHLSCSDKFTGGWGEKDGPVQGVDTAWQIESYFIQKGDKTCGTPTPPTPPEPPEIDIEKFVNGQDADTPTGPEVQVGDTVVLSYEVTNTGPIPLRDIVVTDSDLGEIDCPRSELDPGESMSCDEQEEVVTSPGQVRMEAKVIGIGDVLTPGPPLTSAKYAYRFTFVNGQTLVGSANDKEAFIAGAGGTSADNPTGMIVHLSCSDQFSGGWGEKDGPEQGVDTAWQIESWSIVKLKDGRVDKSCGDPFSVPTPVEVMDDDPIHFIAVDPGDPKIDIEKLVNGLDADNPPGPSVPAGSTVNFTYIVHNNGDVPLTNVAVTDNVVGAITCPKSDLEVGELMFCEPTSMEAETGAHTMESCVKGENDGREVDDCDPVYWEVPPPDPDDPKVDIEKFVNGDDADNPPGPTLDEGSTARFTYLVTNTGDVALTDIVVTDNVVGNINCPRSSLGVGESMECDSTTMKVEAGQSQMEACVKAVGDRREVSDCDPVYYTAKGDPTPPKPVKLGDNVSYESGDGAPNVKATLFKSNPAGDRGEQVRATRTGSNGQYMFSAPAGCYLIIFQAPTGYEFTNGDDRFRQSTCLDPGQSDLDLDAVLRKA